MHSAARILFLVIAICGLARANPLISSITPTTGPTEGGTSVTLQGSGFGTSGTVRFGADPITPDSYSNSTVIFRTPPGEGISNQVRVSTGGTFSNGVNFSYNPPLIGSITPTTISTSGDSTITLLGSSFGLNPSVMVGIAAATVSSRTHSQIVCEAPVGQGANQLVRVTVGGQTSNTIPISYGAPSISSIIAGTRPTAGGTPLTITGMNFGTSRTVSVGGANAPVLPGSGHNQVVCTLPAGEGRNRPVVVTVSGQSSNSSPIDYDPPVISSITPTSGSAAGGIPITITGSNFGLNPSVTVGGSNAAFTSGGISHNQLVVTLPAGQGAAQPVIVTTAGQTSNTASFDYDPPSITGISASSKPTAGGTLLTITGNNFGTTGSVLVNGVSAPVNVQGGSYGNTTIICQLPAGQGVDLPVVLNSAGRSSNTVLLSYDAPSISSIVAGTRPTAGGTPLTITGMNFGTARSVSVGGANAPVLPGSGHTQVVCTLPEGEGRNRPVVVTISGQSSNSSPIDYDPPVISSITPSSGSAAGGIPITITGSNFGLNPKVTVGGSNAAFTSGGVSHNQLVVTLPAGQGAAQPVIVTTAGQTSNTAGFDYDPPSITGISASSKPTAGGTLLTITGSNFGSSGSVLVNGVSAPVNVAGGSYGNTTIICQLPAGQGVDLPVVLNSAGRSSNTVLLSYDAPSISSIIAGTRPTAGGTPLTITGMNFGTSRTVSVGGANAPVLPGSGHNQVVCTLPEGEGRNRPVVVTVSDQSSNSSPIDYDPPVISSITPSSGSAAGGIPITITGSNFGLNPSVTVGGSNAAFTSGGISHNQLVVTLPAGQGAAQPVVVTTAGQTSNTASFDYDPPSITGISASSKPTAGGTLLTITGNNFGTTGSVLVNGVSAPVNVQGGSYGNTTIICQLPAGQGVDLPVVVNSAGRSSNTVLLSYDAPSISSIIAGTRPTAGGTPLTITGMNFGTARSVSVGGANAPVLPGSGHTQVVCTLPAGEGRNRPVVVTVSGQSSNSSPIDYDPPVISSITPTSGSAAGGIPITITGSNFGLNPSVTVGGGSAAFTSGGISHNQLVVTLPAGQGAAQPVVVTTAGQTSNTAGFDYDPPSITGISASSKPTAGGTLLTITGNNFGSSGSVLVNGVSAPVNVAGGSYGNTTIICQLPAGQGTNRPVVVNSSDRSSNTVLLSYDPPLLATLSASTGPTAGGSTLTLTGQNFGITPSVTVSGRLAAIIPPTSHTQVVFQLPEGGGANQQVVLTADGQSGNSLAFSYLPPLITSLNPGSAPIAGGTVITITGTNFTTEPVVTIGGKPATPYLSRGHNRIICTVPAGTGTERAVIVSAMGQASNTMLFDYEGSVFSNWSESINWNGLDSSPGADPRNTGWTNSLAYAFGVDPTIVNGGETASRHPPVFGKPALARDAQGKLQLSFWQRRNTVHPDLAYQVQFGDSPAASPWEPATNPPQVEVVDDTWEFRTYTDHANTPARRFGRVRVELQTQ